jgi:hypothetical protein
MLAAQRGMTPMALRYFGDVRTTLDSFLRTGTCAATPELVERVRDKSRPKPNARLQGVDPDEMNRLSRESGRLAVALATVDDEVARRVLEAIQPYVETFRVPGHRPPAVRGRAVPRRARGRVGPRCLDRRARSRTPVHRR